MRTPDLKPAPGRWLPDMDLNHDKQIQSLLCYRYTIGQTNDSKVEVRIPESRLRSVTPVFDRHHGRTQVLNRFSLVTPAFNRRRLAPPVLNRPSAKTVLPFMPTESRRYH